MNRIKALNIAFFIMLPVFAKTQSQFSKLDSMHNELKTAANDTLRMFSLASFINVYLENDRDSAFFYTEQSLAIAKKLKQPIMTADLLLKKAYILQKQGNLPLMFKLVNESIAITKDERNESNIYVPADERATFDPHKIRLSIMAGAFHQLGNIYNAAGNKEKAIASYKEAEAIRISEQLNVAGASNLNIGRIYFDLKMLDSAMHYFRKAINRSNSSGNKTYQSNILKSVGDVFLKQKILDSAKYYYWQSIRLSKERGNLSSVIETSISLAQLYESIAETDSMFYYANAALKMASGLKVGTNIASSAELISNAYKRMGKIDSALVYLTISKQVEDSINKVRTERLTEFQNLGFEEQMRLEKKVQEDIVYQNKVRTIVLFSGLGILAALAFVFYRNIRQKQKANLVLQKTLSDLQSTQAQLVQSEKMASWGELTAGIAHEIQNPLNFVNNFADLNVELIDELQQELKTGNTEEAIAISNDIKDNEQKINHHGKRADAIVKNMLQHSRKTSGQKELTDMNALCDEYLRLSYHGLRAKDKSFNAEFDTKFDTALAPISVIPQDIGRVILNLINNAFYAVNVRQKMEQDSDYKPLVTLTTSKQGDQVVIEVADNGTGMPDKVKEKIFQPFFTTKPTGEGTGLGLSLSYDIVKAHGGEIKVEATEGEGTEFVILLPITNS
jgi:signal transduction histidine kinase